MEFVNIIRKKSGPAMCVSSYILNTNIQNKTILADHHSMDGFFLDWELVSSFGLDLGLGES